MPQTARAQVARGFQAGQQTAFGTSASPTSTFPTFHFTETWDKSTKLITPSANKAPTTAVPAKERVTFAVHSDALTYDEITWVTETGVKTVTATTQESTARVRSIVPTINAQDTRKTLTFGWGQTGDLWQVNDNQFNSARILFNNDGLSFDGDAMGTQLRVGGALPGATQINKVPILVEDVGVFTQSGFGIATSLSVALDYCVEVELMFGALLAPIYRAKQTERSYAGTVEIAPDWKVRLVCARDQNAGDLSGSIFSLADYIAGTGRYVKWEALSTTMAGSATAYPYQLAFDMFLVVAEPPRFIDYKGLAAVEYVCAIAGDSAGNWLKITETNRTSTFS